MKSNQRHRIYQENRHQVYDAIHRHPLLNSLLQSTLPYVCFLDMQNIFRHCPLKEFHQIHEQYKSQSEELFHHRQNFLFTEGLSSTKIVDSVLKYYRPKHNPSFYFPLRDDVSLDKRPHHVLWILVTQKNMKSPDEPIIDVYESNIFSMYVVAVGCTFFCPEKKQWMNCSQSPFLKNEMDDYALLLLANMFVESSSSSLSISEENEKKTKKTKKWIRKKQLQQLFIFSNDNFNKNELMVHLHKVDDNNVDDNKVDVNKVDVNKDKILFLKYFGP